MEVNRNGTEKWIDDVGDILDIQKNLLTIKVVKQASYGASMSIMGIVILIFLVFILLFIGIGTAWWVGESMGNMKVGFFIVSGIYAILMSVVLLASRKFFIPGIRNLIIRKIYEQD